MPKQTTEKEVSIILLNWNGKENSINCIKSLVKNTNYHNYNIIFVDNGSTDGSSSAIKHLAQDLNIKIDILENKENLGFPKGMNVGIRFAYNTYNPDYYLLLNNDVIFFQKNWLQYLVDAFSDPKIGIANPILYYPNRKLQNIGGKLKNVMHLIISAVTSTKEMIDETEIKKNKLLEINIFLGACFLIKKEVILNIGLLDERYSPYLIEDLEYSLRTQKAGYTIVSVTNSHVIHLAHQTFKKNINSNENKNIEKGYIVIRNAFLLSFDYLGWFKTVFCTSFVLFGAAIVEKKDKTKSLTLTNIKFRKHIWKRISNYFKSYNDAKRLHKLTNPIPFLKINN